MASGLEGSITNVYRSSIGTVHVVGTVSNQSTYTYKFVEPMAAFIDGEGFVIRNDFTFADPDTLNPGQGATFDILFLDAPSGMEFTNITLWIDGNR